MYTAHLEDAKRAAWGGLGERSGCWKAGYEVTGSACSFLTANLLCYPGAHCCLCNYIASFLLGRLILHLPVRASQQCFLRSMGRSFQGMPPATLHLGLDTLFSLGDFLSWEPLESSHSSEAAVLFFLRLVARRPGDLVCFQEILV